ncbi:MAG TPA: hypothetical protein VM510_06315, partial [Caulifigura sp.]|nr:hypothetical protein [Caulifigura sp.]
ISVPEVIMSEEQPKPVAATFKELVAACPGIEANEAGDAMFLADCQKRELTASQATAEWCKTLKDRTAAAREDAKKAQPVAGLVVKLSGLQPVNDAPKGADSGAADTSDPIAAWDEAVEAALPKNGNSRDKARLAVARAKPDLQRAYVNAKNAEAGRTGRI